MKSKEQIKHQLFETIGEVIGKHENQYTSSDVWNDIFTKFKCPIDQHRFQIWDELQIQLREFNE